MATVDEKVMAYVEAELKRSPDMGSSTLFERAKGRFPSIGELSVRQFHARYPLQVKRKANASSSSGRNSSGRKRSKRSRSAKADASAPARRSRSRKAPSTRKEASTKPAGDREAVRAVLMRFATELASAEAKVDVVKVLARTDRYVDDVLAATRD